MTGFRCLLVKSRAFSKNSRRRPFQHESLRRPKSKTSTLLSKMTLSKRSFPTTSLFSNPCATSQALVPFSSRGIHSINFDSHGTENARITRSLATKSAVAAVTFGAAVAAASNIFFGDREKQGKNEINDLSCVSTSKDKIQANFVDITSETKSQEKSQDENTFYQSSPMATSFSPIFQDQSLQTPPPGLRELGKALADMQEKQKVMLGRMLHDLHHLAKKTLSSDGSQETSEITAVGAEKVNEDVHDTSDIYIPQELEKITPREAWGIIQELQQRPLEEGSHSDIGLNVSRKICRSDLKRIFSTAANLLRSEPTVIDLRDREDLEMITVVGDLHGQFDSLLDVFELVGKKGFHPTPPSTFNSVQNQKDTSFAVNNIKAMTQNESESEIDWKSGTPWDGTGAIVFNGDFVDRGDNSLGVLLTIMLLKIAFPKHVILNRGNHEDELLSTVYGFTEELESLYTNKQNNSVDDIWDTIGDVFAALPLCTCTRSAVIMHGGIPSEDFTLDELRSITPEERCRVRSVLETEGCETKEMIQNVMWSDPKPQEGVVPNEDRGAGVCFGPDVTSKFLKHEGFDFLIRSHEPVDMGYERLECDDESAGAVTVFSAAQYPCGEGYNWGAVIRLDRNGGYEPIFFPGRERDDRIDDEEEVSYSEQILGELSKLIAKKSPQLFEAFGNIAKVNKFSVGSLNSNHLITQEQWATVMSKLLDLGHVDWLTLRPYLTPAVNEDTPDGDQNSLELIDYSHFLDLHCNLSHKLDQPSMTTLHHNHSMLLNVFKFLDTDRSGLIDRDEFRVGVELLNRHSKENKVIEDPDALFDSIDDDGNGELDIHEFESAFTSSSMPYHVACFKKFDTDNSGFIDREEFYGSLKALNEHLPSDRQFDLNKADEIFNRLDVDSSGELDIKEFKQLLRDAGYLPSKQ